MLETLIETPRVTNLKLDYARQQGAADIELMRQARIVVVGAGSSSALIINLVRMGINVVAIDPDIVTSRNVPAQGYTWDDALRQTPKVQALADECGRITPDAIVAPICADFVAMSDAQVKQVLSGADLLIMATDHHPAQARGNLAGLVYGVPVILASLYRQGRAGEIIWIYPGVSNACYRCITRTRFHYVARNRTSGTGSAAGSVPFAAAYLDTIVGHLAIAIIKKRRAANGPYSGWIDRLGNRNFVQCRMDPDYRLGSEDIFGDVLGSGEKVFAFDSIWQPGEPDMACPDCRGRGASSATCRSEETTEIEILDCGCIAQKGLDPSVHLSACHRTFG